MRAFFSQPFPGVVCAHEHLTPREAKFVSCDSPENCRVWRQAATGNLVDMRSGADDVLPLLLTVLLFAVALLVPAVVGRFISPGRPPDPESKDDEGGGGPPRPPTPPQPPLGGLPLDHSQPARIRLRDARPRWRRLPGHTRGPVHAPARRPARQL